MDTLLLLLFSLTLGSTGDVGSGIDPDGAHARGDAGVIIDPNG